jgi:hemolysin activation/secretion protein
MTKTTQSLWIMGSLALALSAAPLYAQQTGTQSPDSSQTQQQQQQPDTQAPPSQQQPDQAQPPAGQSGNDAQASADGQTFSGTIAKSGEKYVLQDANGKTYDVDHQEALKQYEGKKVRIKGTLDADGKTIHIK